MSKILLTLKIVLESAIRHSCNYLFYKFCMNKHFGLGENLPYELINQFELNFASRFSFRIFNTLAYFYRSIKLFYSYSFSNFFLWIELDSQVILGLERKDWFSYICYSDSVKDCKLLRLFTLV